MIERNPIPSLLTNTMKKLPIGIQTFSELIEGNYYVDKTALIAELIDSGKYYFLARPRRFGKSLLVSTLKSLFAGEKALVVPHLSKG